MWEPSMHPFRRCTQEDSFVALRRQEVFQRERMSGHYGGVAFVISNTLSAMPFLILIAYFLVLSATSWFTSIQDSRTICSLYWPFYASITAVESLMMAIASVVPNFLMGIIIGAGIVGISMVVCGFFRLPHDIPKPVWRYPVSNMTFDF